MPLPPELVEGPVWESSPVCSFSIPSPCFCPAVLDLVEAVDTVHRQPHAPMGGEGAVFGAGSRTLFANLDLHADNRR